jgi:antitoxin HicB
MTMRYAYPARLEPSDDGSILLSFRDLPEAMTFSGDMMEALASATDCLDAALLIRLKRGEPVPEPSRTEPHEKIVPASLGVAAKAAFARAFAESGMTRVALAEELRDGNSAHARSGTPHQA